MKTNTNKILITGATGFLGQHLEDELRDSGYKNIEGIGSNICDLRIQEDVNNYIFTSNPNIVIHCAATVGGIGANRHNPGQFCYENLIMGANLIEACRKYCENIKKFILIGTVCFTKDAYINTKNTYKHIDQITISDKDILNTYKHKYDGYLYTIHPIGCEKFTCTKEHPIAVKRNNIVTWIKAHDIKVGDILCIPRKTRKIIQNLYVDIPKTDKDCKIKFDKLEITPDIAYLLGWFLAEGCTSQKGSDITLYFGDEIDYINKLIKIIEDLHLHYTLIKLKNQKGYKLLFYNKQLNHWLRKEFYTNDIKTCHYKKIPDFIYNLNDLSLNNFLVGYIQGDGHIAYRNYKEGLKINTIQVSSVSRCLIYQLRDIFLSLDIYASIHLTKASNNHIICNRKVNCNDNWTLKFSGQNCKNTILKLFPHLTNKTKNSHRLSRYNIHHDTNYYFIPVYSILKKYVKNTDVYNLHTINETYTVNNILVHNCSYPKYTSIPFKEDSLFDGYPEETNAYYGIAKSALMVLLQSYRKQYDFPGITLLPVNMYGTGDSLNMATNHVIPAMIIKLLTAKRNNVPEVTLWGTGNPTREFLYVNDCAKAICLAMERYDDEKPVNIGTGKEIKIRDLAELIAQKIEYEGKIIWDYVNPDGQPRRCLDVSRAKEFGFEATTSLSDGLNKTIEWIKNEIKF